MRPESGFLTACVANEGERGSCRVTETRNKYIGGPSYRPTLC